MLQSLPLLYIKCHQAIDFDGGNGRLKMKFRMRAVIISVIQLARVDIAQQKSRYLIGPFYAGLFSAGPLIAGPFSAT